ncbi:hypothetical protein CEXT_52251 [Caerostris extrusa]|uniref:Uncharacterized protein n=1 Tax=Caerostris extrusa TaxID=172846 RepID=A0AAV4XMV3_CAEEX|nr:hypothetical protein CEXT_52251 [Caerostris extrusa]
MDLARQTSVKNSQFRPSVVNRTQVGRPRQPRTIEFMHCIDRSRLSDFHLPFTGNRIQKSGVICLELYLRQWPSQISSDIGQEYVLKGISNQNCFQCFKLYRNEIGWYEKLRY